MSSKQLKIMQWFWFTGDKLMDKYPRTENWDKVWTAYEFVQALTAKALCSIYGHRPERDQCGKPEHDFCFYCNKFMPNSYR